MTQEQQPGSQGHAPRPMTNPMPDPAAPNPFASLFGEAASAAAAPGANPPGMPTPPRPVPPMPAPMPPTAPAAGQAAGPSPFAPPVPGFAPAVPPLGATPVPGQPAPRGGVPFTIICPEGYLPVVKFIKIPERDPRPADGPAEGGR